MKKRDTSMAAALGRQEWRLDHLYQIVNASGQEVPFVRNRPQKELYQHLWHRNIVLKARQLGFTTFIDLLALDYAIFRPHWSAVIIAESKDKASEIFERKILYPYQHLPAEIRSGCPLVSASKLGLDFANGSSVAVMVSARSTTCNFLHVSEYGPVSVLNPAKASEIKTGSFPAVHDGFIFVESTAMGSAGEFYDLVQTAQQRAAQASVPLAPEEFRLHFFPWWRDAEYQSASSLPVPERLLKYFDLLYARYGISLTREQQAWYAITEATLHEKMWSEYPSFVAEAFQAAQSGAYYAEQFDAIIREHRIGTVPYEEGLPVYTCWDLGVSDDTSVWFLQFLGRECHVIDYYAASGEGLSHYAGVLRDKRYRYGGHFAPHDIAVRELGSGVSRLEKARSLGIEFERIPTNEDVPAGIEAVRELLGHCWFDASRCETGLKALQGYKREWDDRHGVYRDHPLHDFCSHGSDAFRTGAVAWRMGRIAGAGMGAASGFRPEEIESQGGLQRLW